MTNALDRLTKVEKRLEKLEVAEKDRQRKLASKEHIDDLVAAYGVHGAIERVVKESNVLMEKIKNNG